MYDLYGGGTIAFEWTLDLILPLIGLAILLLLAVPVWVAIGFAALALVYFGGRIPVGLVGEAVFEGINHFALIAIPLYVLTGDALVRSGLSQRLLDLAEATAGSLRSGLGSSTVLGCGFFSCISGSDAAGAAAVGRITYARLVQRGYPPAYAGALVASGACTGILIPPSIAYIIIGLVLGLPVSTLFIAALIPGVLILGSVMLVNVVMNRLGNYENQRARFSWSHWLRSVWAARYALLIPFIILGGIYSGIFTPTEAAAIAAVTTIGIGLAQRSITLADFPNMLESSAKVCGIIVPIIALSLPLAQALAAVDMPEGVSSTVMAHLESPVTVILLMLVVFMIAGCVMEATPNIVILAPIMLPIAQEIGMEPIHFAVFMITTLGIGFITPPLGLNLFVLSSLTRQSVLAIAWRAVPFVLLMMVAALAVAFIPWLSLWPVN